MENTKKNIFTKLKENKKLALGISGTVGALIVVILLIVLPGNDNTSSGIITTTTSQTTTVEETTTVPESTIKTTTPEETTTEVVETTTEAPTTTEIVTETTTVEETTTKKVEATTTKKQNSGNKGEEETTEKGNADGFYGYNSKRYQVLSTEFEPVNPSWEEIPVMDDVFNFVIKGNLSDRNTWEYLMNFDKTTALYPELLPDLDNICLAWTKGQASIEDIENVCHKNVCYYTKNTTHEYFWLTTYTDQDLTVDTRTAGKPSHFVLYNYSEYYAEELQKSYDKWNSYFKESDADYNNGAAITSNKSHYYAIRKMLVDGYVGIGFTAEYYYLKVYLDKKADRLHVYYVPFYNAYEYATTPLTDEQIEEYFNLPANIRFNEERYKNKNGGIHLRNIPEHDCKFINKLLEN